MGRKTISNRKSLSFHAVSLLFTILLLPLTGSSQLRLNQSQKQQNTIVSNLSVKNDEAFPSKNNPKIDYSFLDFKKGEIYENFNPDQELTEKREQYAKHFRNEDGTTSVVLTAGSSLHYIENSTWKTIDRLITPNNTGRHSQAHSYVNSKNSFKTFYPSNASVALITEYKEGVAIEGANKKMWWLDESYNPINQANISPKPAHISENKITYSNVFSGIDLVYHQQNDGRKMDYIINNVSIVNNAPTQAKYLAFSEDFQLPKGAFIQEEKNEESNTILLNVLLNGNIIFRYDLPIHYDSSGKEITSYYKIVNNTIYTIIDKGWLSSGLEFPVYIDPTVTAYPTASGNYNTGCIDGTQAKTANADIYVGMRHAYGLSTGTRRFFRAWASFNVSSIPDSSTINTVTFGCYIGLNTLSAAYGEYARVTPITSGIPNQATGATLYNMCGENVANQLFAINPGGTGNASLNITSVASTFLSNSLASDIFSLGFAPVGNYDTGFTEQLGVYGSTRPQQTSNGRPYLTITYTETVSCSGIPTGGTASLNPTSGTFGSTFTASVSGSTTGASGLTYQWESAPSASGPWTNVSGATTETSTITAVSTATTTYYRRRITCSNSGQSAYSSVVSYITSCAPSYINGNCAGPGDCQYIGISNVTSGTINNTTGFNNTAPAYNNYSSQSTEVSENNTYSLSVRYQDNGFPVNLGKIAAWIDWNGDNDFSGASEFLGVFNSVTNNQVVTFSFSVPAGTLAGTKRLRIRSAFNSETLTSSDACTLKEYGETEDYSVNVIVINFECAGVDNLSAVIGSPANGINHALNVSWDAVTGATGYDIQYSMDNGDNYNNVGTGSVTGTSAVFNAGDMPNHPFLFRVRAKNATETCDWTVISAPVYTAADNPSELTFGTVTGSSVEVIIPAEIPVANPAYTTYSIHNETVGLYVQADGSLGITEVFQTKANWNTIAVTGLDPETEYCFYAKAKNNDGHIVGEPSSINGTETFTTNANFNNTVNSGAPNNVWWTPASPSSGIAMAYISSGGCSGGHVGYEGTNNNFGSFLRSPITNCTGLDTVTMTFDISNSHFATEPNSRVSFNMWASTAANPGGTYINAVSVNGASTHELYFSEVRSCKKITVVYDLTNATNKSAIYFYLNVNRGYSSSNYFYFRFDNITMSEAAETACITTGSACDAAITGVTNGSGCGAINLEATGSASTTAYRWYDAETGGNLLETTTTGEWTTPVLTQTTTYYVSSYNGECESDRVAVTATHTPTDAEIIFTEGAAACEPGNVTLWAETSNDGIYTINWYDEETGGNLVHTGYTYTVNLAQSTSFYVAAVDGGCESERIEIAAVINAKTWNGSQSTDWNTAANWTPTGVPTAAHCVVIPDVTNAPVISGGNEGFAKSLTLLENASLLVESNATITVTENVTLAIDEITGETAADFTLENNGYLVQTQNTSSNNNNGKITVNKSSTPMFRLEATGWASPVEDQKLYDFAVGTVFGRVYYYDETTNTFSTNGITSESVFEPGQGYSVRAPNTFNPYTESATPTVFEGLFYGKPNNGDISINVTANNLGYNYVGNPYPSPIDAAEFLSSNSNVASLYFWTHEAPPIGGVYMANNYASFTSMGGTMAAAGGEEPDGIIQVGQGFVVKTSQQYLLQFTNDLRIPNSNGQFFRNNTEKHRMWLNLSDNTTNYNQILVGYVENASMDADHQIDAKMFGYSGNAIYSLIENERYVIQGRSLPFDNNDIVPIGFKATNAGNFTISISKKDGLFENEQLIYLKDLALNITHNLSESAYSFLTEAGTFENRFEIVYQNEPLSVNQPGTNSNDWIVYKDMNNQTLTIESKGFEINEVEIFDLTGRLLLNKKNINAGSFTCQNNFADQVLLVKLNKTLIKKIL